MGCEVVCSTDDLGWLSYARDLMKDLLCVALWAVIWLRCLLAVGPIAMHAI